MRKRTVIILAKLQGERAIHFTERPLAGADNDTWFKIGNQELFTAIENILIEKRIANNLTLVTELRQNGNDSFDYTITYNPIAAWIPIIIYLELMGSGKPPKKTKSANNPSTAKTDNTPEKRITPRPYHKPDNKQLTGDNTND